MSNNSENKVKERQPIKLLKNRIYPTYQLYAVVNSKISAEEAMVIAVLETFSWLRKRFRDLTIPDEINYPEPDKYKGVKLDDFKSFRINEGYVVDVVFIKEKGVWAFQLVEPDLGPEPGNENQERKPAPGRVFATNIAFRIYNGKLECGFKTVCSEPENTKVVCEVFRLAVVKCIVRNELLGLEQIIPIIRDTHQINSTDKLDRLINYIRSNERQLPFVLTVEYKKIVDFNSLIKNKPGFDINNLLNRNIDGLMVVTDDVKEEPIEAKMREMAGRKMGYAQFGFLPDKYIKNINDSLGCNISSGDVCVFYPEKYNQKKLFKRDSIKLNEKQFLADLEKELQEFPKYKNINFGNVIFINEARIEELNKIIELSNSKEEIIKAIEDKIKVIELKYEDNIAALSNEMHEKDEKIDRLKAEIKELNEKVDKNYLQVEKFKSDHNDQINKLNLKIEWKDSKLNQPSKTEDIPEWVEKQFAGKLIFHNRAIGEIKKTPTGKTDMSLVCDAINYLANEYRDERLGLISKDESNNVCSDKYNRSFEVTPVGEKSIEMYTKEYKVKYRKNQNVKSKEVLLDQHLKVGKGNKDNLRIYFFYDEEKDLIVVGSLPKHLSAVNKKKD
jgi:hypothetical protein